MIKLKSFRLVNVRANNNTIVYPDVTFNLNEENTLIDCKNGGGKTLAVQMLFQTVLPNSYFEKNKTISTLFDGVPLKTTMHCVSCFQLEEQHEYNTICLGFAVTKSQEFFGDLHYINYVVENSNANGMGVDDIHLINNDKVLSIADLKKSLAEKSSDTVKVTIFEDQPDEYTEYLKQFDIYSNVFKFIMSINRTENYIQQYFEKHCKTQQGLLTEFIIPNTISALDEKKSSLKSKDDDISILAQCLLEKSKSINELRTVQDEVVEYGKVVSMIDAFLLAFENNHNDFTNYVDFLNEYPKQYVAYSNDVENLKLSIRQNDEEVKSLTLELSNLNESIEYLITRKMECNVADTQAQLTKSEQYYNSCVEDRNALLNKYHQMVATNSVLEYKSIENILNMLNDTTLQSEDISSYANTIYEISNMQVVKTEYEMDYVKKRITELNESLYGCMESIGGLKKLSIISQDNIMEWQDQVNDYLVQVEELQSKLNDYDRYSQSMLENEELFAIVDAIKEYNVNLDTVSKKYAIVNTNLEVYKAKYQAIKLSIEDNEKILNAYSSKKKGYLSSLEVLKNELSVEEFEFENKYNEFISRQNDITIEINSLLEEINTLKDEVATIKKYGILRDKSRYDALEWLQNELETACFGTDILQGILLEKFPSLAEVVVVSNKDYQNLKNGKKRIPEYVAKQNFAIMPYDTIRNINKLTFSEMMLLTPNLEYYKSAMNSNELIEARNKKILQNKSVIERLHKEYDSLQVLCNRISAHLGTYSYNEVQKINSALEQYSKNRLELNSKLSKFKKSIDKNTSLLEEHSNEIDTLKQSIKRATDKKALLEKVISCTNEVHKYQIFISAEKKKLNKYTSDIKDANILLTSIESKITSLTSDFEYQKSSILIYKSYILEVKDYVNKSVKPIDSKDLELLVQKFRLLKNKSTLVGFEPIKPNLVSVLEAIKHREIFKTVDFDSTYNLNTQSIPFDDDTISKCKEDLEKSEILLKRQSEYIISENSSLEVYMNSFDGRLNADDTQYDQYRQYSISAVERLLTEHHDRVDHIKERIALLTEERSKLKTMYDEGIVQSRLYKFFCQERRLNLDVTIKDVEKVSFNDMTSKFNALHDSYTNALNMVNGSIKNLYSSIDSLNISEQVKYTIKNNAIVKQRYSQIVELANSLRQLKAQTEAMIKNLKTTVENIGRIDEDITDQLYRILTEILDETCAIPKISKCKIGNSYLETFKINLYQGGKGCRFSEERIKNSIRKYVSEIAKDISIKYYDKNKVRELLSIDNIIRFGIDMNRLNIQILKIDQEKPIYQNWENVIASSGQEYIMYVMFTVTMVKYFSNVMGDTNKAPLFIFLDNPFASASDVQLWQPVRNFLDKNDAQLLCLAHNVPTVSQILFERQIILEQSRSEDGILIDTIRNQKTETKENVQLSLFDSLEV